jgi:threonine-phosphate decarboxylase
LLGNGASELIFLTVASLRPRRVLILGPTFTEYERAARAWGAEVDVMPLPEEAGFRLGAGDLDLGEAARRLRQADLLFLCDPNNPTGALLDGEARRLLFDEARRAEAAVFVDESFLAFTSAWPEGSATRGAWPHVIVLHSFTKILCMPGLRVGGLVVPARWREDLRLRLPPWNLNCVAQSAALTAFAHPELTAEAPNAVAEARRALAAGLAALPGVDRVLPADANFLCIRLKLAEASGLAAVLREEHGVLVRDLTHFPGLDGRYLRVAVRSSPENRVLLEAVTQSLGENLTSPGATGVSGVIR